MCVCVCVKVCVCEGVCGGGLCMCVLCLQGLA